MASNRGQGGIQQLLAAEQEAQRIVNAAKNGIFILIFLSSHVFFPLFHQTFGLIMCLCLKFMCYQVIYVQRGLSPLYSFYIGLFIFIWKDEFFVS